MIKEQSNSRLRIQQNDLNALVKKRDLYYIFRFTSFAKLYKQMQSKMLRFLFMQCFADFVHTYIIFSIFLSFDTTRIGTQKIDFVSNRMAFYFSSSQVLILLGKKNKSNFILYYIKERLYLQICTVYLDNLSRSSSRCTLFKLFYSRTIWDLRGIS